VDACKEAVGDNKSDFPGDPGTCHRSIKVTSTPILRDHDCEGVSPAHEILTPPIGVSYDYEDSSAMSDLNASEAATSDDGITAVRKRKRKGDTSSE